MDATFFAAWAVILAFDGVLMAWFEWAVTSARFGQYRIRPPQNPPVPPAQKFWNTNLNNLLALAILGGFFFFLGERSLYAGWPGAAHLLGEVLGVLLLYDLMYYGFHRLMHVRRLMRYCHNVHHRVRSTTATVSIFIHPLENLGGVGLLVLAIWLVGPISTVSFLVMFAAYSVANIVVHSNLRFPHPAFRLFNFWAAKHDIHHHKARNNYSSIFPFWDQAFGTYE